MNLNKFIKEERVILLICLFVFIMSSAYAFYFKIRPAVDAQTYDMIAMNILEGRGFRLNTDVSLIKDDAINYQGPLYQYFLAGIYFIFGHRYEAVWIIQAFLHALSALFLFLICKKIFSIRNNPGPLSLGYGENDATAGRKAGWMAAIFFGFYPDLIEIGAMLMTEIFFLFLSILVIYFFVKYFDKPRFWGVVLLALSFGAAILVRSGVGIFLPVFLFYFYRRRAYNFFILFLVLIFVILTPWTVRNYFSYGKFLPTMANFGFNLWVGNYEGGDGEGGNRPELVEATKRYGVIEANNYAVGRFKNFLKAHPLTYVKLTVTRTIKYFSFIRPMGFWFYHSGWSQLIFVLSSALASVFLFTFGFAGIFFAIKEGIKDTPLIYLILFAFLTCAPIVAILIETRYRIPIYPFMAIFSGVFIAKLATAPKKYLKYLMSAFIILSFSSIINIIMEFNKIIEKLGQIFS